MSSPQLQHQTYKVAEVFYSIQGEGVWTGTPMLFIRLAGCNVGKPVPSGQMIQLGHDQRSSEYLTSCYPAHTLCTGWDNKQFLCDTDYGAKHVLSVDQLLNHSMRMEHICLTGGEPFIHQLGPLVKEAQSRKIYVHVETSGSRPFVLTPLVNRDLLWITCAPKLGFIWDADHLAEIDEFKLVVSAATTYEEVMSFLEKLAKVNKMRPPIYLQPITNNVDELDRKSMDRCLELVMKEPWLRVSLQTHKVWRVR